MKDDSEYAIFESGEKEVWKEDTDYLWGGGVRGLDEGRLVEEGVKRKKDESKEVGEERGIHPTAMCCDPLSSTHLLLFSCFPHLTLMFTLTSSTLCLFSAHVTLTPTFISPCLRSVHSHCESHRK